LIIRGKQPVGEEIADQLLLIVDSQFLFEVHQHKLLTILYNATSLLHWLSTIQIFLTAESKDILAAGDF